MSVTGIEIPVAGTANWGPAPVAARRGRLRSLVRGRAGDPAWVRPAAVSLILVTGLLYTWDLGASGWANSFYSAAVQAGTKSWKAFFFGSFDASNFITVDKSPGALWVMELSARVFGVNAWSILVPNAVEGMATVALLYATVRRWFSPAAALLAGGIVALTPVAALMFRFNNPDAFLVLLLTASAYATVRAIEDGRSRWIVLAGALVGFGFLAKMLQAFLVLPGLGAAYLVAAPGSWTRRVRELLYGAGAVVVAAGWWVAAVMLTPAADRPYIGGSQDNSLWNLVFGYNGFGRLTGNETGSVGGNPTGGSPWGPTGLTRLFAADMGSQISWLLPAALILLVAGLVYTARQRRRDRTRASLIMWGGWLLTTGAAFSLGRGIIHPYYTVALAPAIGALVAIGGSAVWPYRRFFVARAVLSSAIAATALWSVALMDRSPGWMPWLRPFVLLGGLAAAAALLVAPQLSVMTRRVVITVGVAASLAGPFAYTLDTVNTPHAGAIPSAGPAVTTSASGPGGAPGASRRFFAGGLTPTGGSPGGFVASPAFSGQGTPGGGRGGPGFGAAPPGAGPGGGSTGAAGGLLNGSDPSSTLVRYLESGASDYEWVAATTGANEAAGYQLATGDPVMAIGGFNGTDPTPTLAAFERYVSEGKIHYYIAGGGSGGGSFGRGGFAGPGGGSGDSSQIADWVESHFSATTVGGVTLYDLSSGAGVA